MTWGLAASSSKCQKGSVNIVKAFGHRLKKCDGTNWVPFNLVANSVLKVNPIKATAWQNYLAAKSAYGSLVNQKKTLMAQIAGLKTTQASLLNKIKSQVSFPYNHPLMGTYQTQMTALNNLINGNNATISTLTANINNLATQYHTNIVLYNTLTGEIATARTALLTLPTLVHGKIIGCRSIKPFSRYQYIQAIRSGGPLSVCATFKYSTVANPAIPAAQAKVNYYERIRRNRKIRPLFRYRLCRKDKES